MSDWQFGEGEPPRWVKIYAALVVIAVVAAVCLPAVLTLLSIGWGGKN